MPKLIEIKCPIAVWGDIDKLQKRFNPDPDLVEKITVFEHTVVRDVSIPLSTVNEAQNLQDVAAVQLLYIEMNRNFDLYLNGSATPLEFRRLDDALANEDEKVRAFLQCTIASVGIGNPSTTEAIEGIMVLGGDVDE